MIEDTSLWASLPVPALLLDQDDLIVDSNPSAAAALGVRGIPALFLFKDGQVISNKTGATPKAALKSWIDDAI